MQELLLSYPNLAVRAAAAEDLVVAENRVAGVVLADGSEIAAGRVILTTGTFLGGLIHIGEERVPAGRVGEAPS
ncbi:FAD-dependent oxidoreductase, partial [Vibrio parahaemolyticus]